MICPAAFSLWRRSILLHGTIAVQRRRRAICCSSCRRACSLLPKVWGRWSAYSSLMSASPLLGPMGITRSFHGSISMPRASSQGVQIRKRGCVNIARKLRRVRSLRALHFLCGVRRFSSTENLMKHLRGGAVPILISRSACAVQDIHSCVYLPMPRTVRRESVSSGI